jgi:glyoxylase-like metal-dependent hydrolase (beta-lactamase superfamily II)
VTGGRPVCARCGVQAAEEAGSSQECDICADERQPRLPAATTWIAPDALAARHRIALVQEEADLWSLSTAPRLGIGQRCFLVRTAAGNVLWDCPSLLGDDTLAHIQALGGIAAIALSHPHFYGASARWSEAFGGVPVLVHDADRAWAARLAGAREPWSGERREVVPGVTLAHCGGHFAGSCVLHWQAGAGGTGVLCGSDTIHVCAEGTAVSFLYSYPNLVPLDAAAVEQIAERALAYPFTRLYGAFGEVVGAGAAAVVERSARRYVGVVRGDRR